MNDTIGIGIIGVGLMGMLHARIFAQLPETKIVAVCDPALKKAPLIPGQIQKPELYGNHKELVSRDDVGAVIIATPEDLHREFCVDAANHGKHILLEKPIATTLEDAQAIVDEASRNRVKLMMGHILRYDTRYAQIKAAVDDGTIGKPLVCYARRNAPIQEARRLGGRCEVEEYISVHDIDQAFWYFQDDAMRVSAEIVEGPVMKELGVHDFIWITIRFKDGGLAVIETGWGLSEEIVKWKRPESWGGFGDVSLELIGERGSLYLDYRPMTLTAVDNEGWKFPDTLHWPLLHGEVTGDVFYEDLYFLNVLKGKKPIISTGEDGMNALKVVLAAQRSYREGLPIDL